MTTAVMTAATHGPLMHGRSLGVHALARPNVRHCTGNDDDDNDDDDDDDGGGGGGGGSGGGGGGESVSVLLLMCFSYIVH